MSNTTARRNTLDPNGVYWTVSYALDTAATVIPVPTGTIIQPLRMNLGTAGGTGLLGSMTLTNGADVTVASFGIGYSASSFSLPLSQIPYMDGFKIVLNAITGTGATIALTLSFKYLSGTAPVVA